MIAKEKYLSYKIGDRVILNKSDTHDSIWIDKGTEFTIISFPPKTVFPVKGDKHQRFIYGKTDDKRKIRAFISEVAKIN